MKKENIPNMLSVLRIISVPAFLVNFFLDYNGHMIVALAIFVFAGITDVVDGKIARKFECVSSAGKFLDPLADKLVQTSVLVALTFTKIIPLEIFGVFLVKEIITALGALLIYKKRSVITVSNVFGKLSTVSFYVTMGIVILLHWLRNGEFINMSDTVYRVVIISLCLVSVLFALIAIIKYIVVYNKYLFDNKNEKADTYSENR